MPRECQGSIELRDVVFRSVPHALHTYMHVKNSIELAYQS